MKIKDLTLFAFLQNNPLLWVPLYQRNFNWKNEQFEELSKDLNNIILSRKQEEHYLGTMVFLEIKKTEKDSEKLSLEIIDGQQRLTTIFIMLLTLRDICKTTDPDTATKIEDLIISKDNNELKLQLHSSDNSDLQWLLETKSTNPLIKNNQIKSCYNYFEDAFRKIIKQNKTSVSEILEGINRLKLIFLHANKEENAQLIYDRINTAGLKLSTFDKLKNIIYLKCNQEEQKSINGEFRDIERYLSSHSNSHKVDPFLYYLYICLEVLPPTGDMFKKYEELIERINSIDDLFLWVKKMKLFAYIYGRHIKGGSPALFVNSIHTERSVNGKIRIILLHFRTFGLKDLFPAIMSELYAYYNDYQTEEEVTLYLYKLLLNGLKIIIYKGDKTVFFTLAKRSILNNKALNSSEKELPQIALKNLTAFLDVEKVRSITEIENIKKNRLVLKYFIEDFDESHLLAAGIAHINFRPYRDQIYDTLSKRDIKDLTKPLGMEINPINDQFAVSNKRPYFAIINGVELEPVTWKELNILSIKTIVEQQRSVYDALVKQKSLTIPGAKQSFVSMNRYDYEDYEEAQVGTITYYINTKPKNANAILSIIQHICDSRISKIECI